MSPHCTQFLQMIITVNQSFLVVTDRLQFKVEVTPIIYAKRHGTQGKGGYIRLP